MMVLIAAIVLMTLPLAWAFAPGLAEPTGPRRVSLADWAGMAATSFVAALLQAANGFGFAVLAVPLFLLFADPGPAVQLVVIVTLALSAVVLPGMRDAVDRPLLLRLGIGAAFGLPLGLVALRLCRPGRGARRHRCHDPASSPASLSRSGGGGRRSSWRCGPAAIWRPASSPAWPPR